MSIQGTTRALRFLVTRWRYLDKKYPGDRPFCIMLRILSEDGSKHQVIYERE
jgi:hypothetical protein